MARYVFVLCLVFSSSAFADYFLCSFGTTTLNFGNYDVFSTAHDDSTGGVTWRCFLGSGNVIFSLSQGSSGTYTTRTMKSGSNSLNYQLYTNATRTTIWGNGSSGTSTVTDSGSSTSVKTLTVYGRITAGQDAAVGTYSDTIMVTINY